MAQCKESTCDAEDAGDPDSISGWERSPGEEHGNPLQYSCLENPMNRGAWRSIVHGVAESDMTEVIEYPHVDKILFSSLKYIILSLIIMLFFLILFIFFN